MFKNQATASSDQLRWATSCIIHLGTRDWASNAYFFVYIERNSSYAWPCDFDAAVETQMPALKAENRIRFMTPRAHSMIRVRKDGSFTDPAAYTSRVIGNDEAIQQLGSSGNSRGSGRDDTLGLTTTQHVKVSGWGFLTTLMEARALAWLSGMPRLPMSEQDEVLNPGAGSAIEQLWAQMVAYQRLKRGVSATTGEPSFRDTGKGPGRRDDLVVALVLVMHYASNMLRRSGFLM